MTSAAFTGTVEFKLSMRAFGHAVSRKMQARYAYIPPWPYFDVETGAEEQEEMAMSVGLSLLAVSKSDKDRVSGPHANRRYWTPADQLIAVGVLRTEIWHGLRDLIDSDARRQDIVHRVAAGLPGPSIYSPDSL